MEKKQIVVQIDRSLCIGNAMCRELAPGAFIDDGEGRTLVDDPSSESVANLLEAEALCPVGAISVLDGEDPEG